MSSKFCFTDFAAAIMLCAVSQAFYAILQKTGVCTSFGTFPVCGSFDNPAGVASALAFSLPFCLGLVGHRYSYVRKIAWASIAIIAMGVIVFESRSGILAVCMVMFVFFVMRRKCVRKLWMIFSVVGLVAVAVFLYHYKQDSADGRLLIWRCTWSVIRESPWIGYGIGGFQAQYMDAQADYFKAHPGSPYVMLADNTQAPFNEYLGLLTEFGFVGGIVLLVGVVLLLQAWRKHPYGSSLCGHALPVVYSCFFLVFLSVSLCPYLDVMWNFHRGIAFLTPILLHCLYAALYPWRLRFVL